jgi:IMP dehydrogenase
MNNRDSFLNTKQDYKQNSILSKKFLAYDDVLLTPKYSEVLPSEVMIHSKFSKNIPIKMPIASAAMDTVTESKAAIVMAQEGGIGVIHKNFGPKDQASEVDKVKKYETGVILRPITVAPNDSLKTVVELTRKHKITGVPVVDSQKKLVGILTSRDMQFEENLDLEVQDIMTKKEKLITAGMEVTMAEARELLHRHRIEKLPIIDSLGQLEGLITMRDISKIIHFPFSNKDSLGRLRVAAAVGVGPHELERVGYLVDAQVDAIVVDTAHGHSRGVMEMVKKIKERYPRVDVIAGNVATKAACIDLIKVGVDGIKVGIGPGSICTTRIVAGIGVPQFSAVLECAEVCNREGVPLIADGGIKYSGDLVKALAAGADCVMIGSLLAGTDETPGEMVLYQGRTYKIYRGMGSIGAMQLGSKDRYGQGCVEEIKKLVPEGIEGQVPYRGSLASNLYQLIGGLRAGMGYVGAKTLMELKENAEFLIISAASLKEGHPHDVIITKEAPNYRLT